MKIAFVFLAEAYQIYHAYTVALELSQKADCDVTVYYNDPTAPAHLDRIAAAYGVKPVTAKRLKRGFFGWLIQSIKILGMARMPVMNANKQTLLDHDIVVSVESDLAWLAKRRKNARPIFVYRPHGSGDRDVTWHPRAALFDLLLPSGEKTRLRFLEEGLAEDEANIAIAYLKTEVTEKLRQSDGELFAEKRPMVLYNPHKTPDLSSWPKAIEPLLAQFKGDDEFNLIVAPHIKKFRRRSARLRRQWEARSTGSIMIDTQSQRLLDNSYTGMADIYIGDVSSQVYEFTARPRPCVFLNLNKVEWRDDPNFLFWQMGEVVENAADILDAVKRAPALHPQYIEIQKKLTREALGEQMDNGSGHAAQTILDFYHHSVSDSQAAATKPA